MSTAPATIVSVGWPAGPAYAGAFLLDSPTRGVLNGTTYTLAADVLVELAGVLDATTSSGRSARYDSPTAGTATITIEDPNRLLDPTNTAGPFYGNLDSGRALTVAARWTVGGTAVTVPTWAGYVEDLRGDYRTGADRVTITGTDLIGRLAGITIPASPESSRPAETVATRLRWLISLLGLPVSEGAVETGRTLVAQELAGANVLDIIRNIETADLGRLTVTPTGAWEYLSNLTDGTPELTFSGIANLAAGEIPASVSPMLSTNARYWNSVTAIRIGGLPQTVEDLDAIALYGRRSPQPFTDLPLELDSDALDVANIIYTRGANRAPRPSSVSVNVAAIAGAAGGSAGTAATMLGAVASTQAATVSVVTAYRTGSPSEVTSVGIVDRITHQSAAGRWATTVDLSPIPLGLSALELDSASLAQLDTARLGF